MVDLPDSGCAHSWWRRQLWRRGARTRHSHSTWLKLIAEPLALALADAMPQSDAETESDTLPITY
jgi:hypothetical protein